LPRHLLPTVTDWAVDEETCASDRSTWDFSTMWFRVFLPCCIDLGRSSKCRRPEWI
jgi:hypothetical protein